MTDRSAAPLAQVPSEARACPTKHALFQPMPSIAGQGGLRQSPINCRHVDIHHGQFAAMSESTLSISIKAVGITAIGTQRFPVKLNACDALRHTRCISGLE